MQNFIDAYSYVNLSFLMDGLMVTIQVSVVSIVLSFVIGGLLGVLRFANIKVLSRVIGLIVDIIRNLPLLLIIFFTYFALPQIGIKFSIFWAAVAALTIFESAMLSEIFRAGLNAVPKGQMEAGLSTGLTYTETLIKDTSLAVIISLPELTHNAKIIYGQNEGAIIPMFVAMTVMYFVVCYALSLFSKYLETKQYNY